MTTTLQKIEFQEQSAFVEWCHWNEKRLPWLRLAFHCPNGGYRFKTTAGKLKALGVRPGVPDWMCPVPRRFSGLAIEFKSPGGKVSPDQETYFRLLRDAGWMVAVCFHADTAIDAVERYFK